MVNLLRQNAPLESEWPKTGEEARAVQEALRHEVRLENDFGTIKTIAGVDVSYDIKHGMSRAFIVLIRMSDLKPQQHVEAEVPTPFPYIPGLLSFREIPAILKALELLPEKPDMFMVDGQGVAHPRRLGIAAHLGVLTDMPSIGVAKSRLVGEFTEPGHGKGGTEPLMHKAERIGTVIRSKTSTRPLFISPGHRVDQDTAVEITLKCITQYRLPEPTRIADKLSKMKEPATAIFI